MPTPVSFARAGLVSVLVAFGVFAGLTASAALTSGDSAELQIQGDVDCDEDVDANDALDNLVFAAHLDPATQHEPCTDIGAAIPAVEGPGISLFANVASDGTLEGGTATGAIRTETGVYQVTFATDVSGCAAVASAGTTGGGSFSQLAVGTTGVGLDADPKKVLVTFNIADPPPNFNTQFVDTDFHLIVVC